MNSSAAQPAWPWLSRSMRETMLIIFLALVLGAHLTSPDSTLVQWLLGVALFIGIAPVFWSTGQALRNREWASMDMLASVALIFSLIEGEWSSAVFIALMLAAARLLERLTAERTEQSVRGLLKLRPLTAKVERNGHMETVPVEAVRVGEVVVVDAGERVAVDGRVLSGQAAVDEASLTGESLPVDKEPGSGVSSSTLVVSGSLTIKTERIGQDTTLQRIIALVESSRAEKPAIETLGNRFGKFYLGMIFVGAAALLAVTHDVKLVLAVVLVVCADDVAIAIPLAYLRAISSAAKRGIVVKGGRHLETLGKVDTLVFDKTGTLTLGRPRVTAVVPVVSSNEREVLRKGALAAQRSTHPLSRTLVRQAEAQGISTGEIQTAEVIGGQGVVAEAAEGQILVGRRSFIEKMGIPIAAELSEKITKSEARGESLVFVATADAVLGFVAFSDTLRPEARAMIQRLRQLGVRRLVMLSGDHAQAAESLGKELGLDRVYANLFPADKVSKLKELSREGVVAMVGDGVNDAAALALAHVGIAMGGLGADGAIESANIVLMRDDLSAIPETIALARSVRRISVQDFFIWGATNVVGLSLVLTGIIGPPGAAAYNFVSDFFPLFNSLRARMPKR